MKHLILQVRLFELEHDAELSLRKCIEDSHIDSKHVESKAIEVDVFRYTELVIVNDRLTFLDKDGMHYDLYAECTIVDLINILVAQM